MATVKWKGGAPAVVQIDDGEITGYDAASTYTVTMGGYTISQVGTTDAATTAAALVALLNASEHPYFARVTWSNPTGGEITATADVAGEPFAASLTVSGGTGTVDNFTSTQACTGPYHCDEPENYEGGALPGASDDLIIDQGTSILYGLDGITATLSSVDIRQTFLGAVGLEPSAFSEGADGGTLNDFYPEYRNCYLELNCPVITIGDHDGPGDPTGSPRIMIDQQSTAESRLVVVNTVGTTALNKPAVRYLASDVDADVGIESAPGGVGLGSEPGETATFGDVLIADDSTESRLYIGAGVTFSNLDQFGGLAKISAAATIASIEVDGGELEISGEGYLITTLTVRGGVVTDTHRASSGDDWTTINAHGGELVLPGSTDPSARNAGTLNISRGAVEADWSRFGATTLDVSIAAGHSPLMRLTAADV